MIKPKNLLIVRTDRIGDVVLSLPMAEIVKKYFPDCRITFLIREYTKPLVQSHPFVDEIITLSEDNSDIPVFKNVKRLKKFNFDSAILVYPTFTTALVIFLSRIKNRIGTGYRWYSFLFNKKVFEHRKYAEKHELEYNVNLLRKFGIEEKVDPEIINFNLIINSDVKEKVKQKLKEKNIDLTKPVIIIHPGSGGSAIDLPIDKYKMIVESLTKKLFAEFLITGSKDEIELCRNLEVSDSVKNLAGVFNLKELISVIDYCDIFISNSTGPIHIAAALGKYTVGFYPNLRACSAKRWGPYTNKKVVFSPENECEECKREQCDSVGCMNSIKVTDVIVDITKIYNVIRKNGDYNAE